MLRLVHFAQYSGTQLGKLENVTMDLYACLFMSQNTQKIIILVTLHQSIYIRSLQPEATGLLRVYLPSPRADESNILSYIIASQKQCEELSHYTFLRNLQKVTMPKVKENAFELWSKFSISIIQLWKFFDAYMAQYVSRSLQSHPWTQRHVDITVSNFMQDSLHRRYMQLNGICLLFMC